MDKPLSHLDHHFHLPGIRHVDASRPLQWLRSGWQDMLDNLAASLPYGVFFAVAGYLILAYAADMPYLFTAAISGFFLIGPIAACGLYEISRRSGMGERIGFADSLRGLRGHGDNLLYMGLMLALMLIAWERLSAILFALFYQGSAPDLSNVFADIFLSGNYVHFVVAYLVIGGALAALVFALTAVAVPMLMARDTDLITAMMASARAVGCNLGAMAVWAALIVVMVAIGFASLLFGMVVIMPLLGHATWHAYQDLIE